MSKITTAGIYKNMKENVSNGIIALGTYIVITVVIIYLYYQIYLASKDEKAFTKNFIYNMITIVAPVILMFSLIIFTTFEKELGTYVIFGSLLICGLIYIIFYFLKTKISTYIFNDYLLYTVIGLLILIGLSIIFTLFSGTLRKLNGWIGFFSNLIFYIPCLIRDFIKVFIQEYNSSSTTLFVLFVFEILLFILYFLILPLLNNKALPEKTVILDDPVMINTKMDMCDRLKDSTSSNFGLSMWIYLNSMPKTKKSYTEETAIFNYSDQSGTNPHIKITYFNNDRGSNDFIMYVGSQKFNISLPLQKWNNFVINYTTYDADITTGNNKKEFYGNGDIYEGEMKQDGPHQMKEGKGKYTYANGDSYLGQWVDNRKNGLGVFTYAGGRAEEGKWVNDEQKSFFTYETKTGDFIGTGTIEDPTGTYVGDIKYGKKHGYGTMTYTATATVKNPDTGFWRNDVFLGEEDKWIQSDDSDISLKIYTVDIFINGVLERSYTFKNSETPIFNKKDIMMIGSGELGNNFQSSGLYGAICNIVYYKKPLSQLAIIYNYNLLSIKNPPIVY